MADFPITGIPSSFLTPGTFWQLLVAQGPSTAGAGERATILIMPMLAAGTWAPNTVYRVRNEAEAELGAGAGSPLHRAARRYLKANNISKLWALPYAETSGGGEVAADLTVTWTTDPTAQGSTTLWVCGEPLESTFTDQDTVTTIAADMAARVNAKTHLPVTATSLAGVLTLVAKLKGKSQGDGTYGAIRVHVDISQGVGTTVATENLTATDALGLGTGTTGADGTTTEEENLEAALATIEGAWYYYKVISAWDATSLGHLNLHMATVAQPIPGLPGRGYAAFMGPISAAAALAIPLNSELIELQNQPNGEEDPATLAANAAAVYQKGESNAQIPWVESFDNYRETDWLVPAAWNQADWPDPYDINDGLTDGVCVIASDEVGSFISRASTTRSKDATGTVNDTRALEPHRISGMHGFLLQWKNRDISTWNRYAQRDDVRLPNGDIDHAQVIPPNTLTPYTYLQWFRSQVRIAGDAGVWFDTAQAIASAFFQIDPNNGGRIEGKFDPRVTNLAHQRTLRASEVSPG
jgi:phage tail sheath gpL-like